LALWDSIRQLSRAVHQNGINQGRDLLTSLASGKITLDALNEATTRSR